MNRNIVFPAIAALLLFCLAGCVKPLKAPRRYEYSVSVSSDLLKLFKVESANTVSDQAINVNEIKNTEWTKQIIVDDGFKPEMTVRLTARKGAKDGTLLTKEVYQMSIDCAINDGRITSVTTKGVVEDGGPVTFQFKVPVPSGANPDDIGISMPHLKYDKHFAFCFTIDDSYVNGWSKLFKAMNGRWVDDIEFFHFGLKKTTGYQPEHSLCFTDGCGNDRNFTFGEAIWPSWWNEYSPDGFIKDENHSEHSPYISWEELQIMTDLGNAVHWHNVDENKWDKTDVSQLVLGLKEDYDRTMEKIGYPMKTLAQPDGSKNYLDAAQQSPLVCLTRATTSNIEISLYDSPSLFKKNIFGGYENATIERKLVELEKQAASDSPQLLGMLVHRCGQEYVDFFQTIYAKYGKGGSDSIWVTTYDELYEYFERRNAVEFSSTVADGYKVFQVTLPYRENFIYDELSFVITGADSAAVPVSENLVGFSSAQRADGTVLVNCNFSPTLIDRIGNYTNLFNATSVEEYRLDAEYLISLLRADLRETYLARIGTQPVEPPHEPDDPDNPDDPDDDRRELPISGIFNKKQIKWYIDQYDGYVINVK